MATANRILPEMGPLFEGVESSSDHLKSILMKLLRRSLAYQLAMIFALSLYWIAVRSDVAGDTHCQLLHGGTNIGMERPDRILSNVGRPNPESKESVHGDGCPTTHQHLHSVQSYWAHDKLVFCLEADHDDECSRYEHRAGHNVRPC